MSVSRMVQLQNRTAKNATSEIAMVTWPHWPWLFQMQKFWQFGFYGKSWLNDPFHSNCGWTIHPTAKVSEEANRKCYLRNTTTVQLSTPYTDPEGHNTQCYKQTNRRQYHDNNQTVCSSI